jgi:hypothetical protein
MMEPRYLQKDLVTSERGSLVFTQKESKAMQNEVRRRAGTLPTEVVNAKLGEQ